MVITIAGGGSTFTAGIVKSIALRREELEVDEIRLFDITVGDVRIVRVLETPLCSVDHLDDPCPVCCECEVDDRFSVLAWYSEVLEESTVPFEFFLCDRCTDLVAHVEP